MSKVTREVARPVRASTKHFYSSGSGHTVSVMASTIEPGLLRVEIQRKLRRDDVKDGRLITGVEERYSHRGGKYILNLSITHDIALMLRSLLGEAIHDSRIIQQAELSEGRPIDIERYSIEKGGSIH